MADQQPQDPLSSRFVPVCAIGASAGGVGVLQRLFRLLPDDLGLAYVVIVHLAPDHPSSMHEILGACTSMPVHQVRDGPALKANCVYVIAPDSELVIEGDDVKSRPFTDPRGRRAPIDMFFRSVAAARGDGIAVVLTGAGADGAVGVRAIKEAGGIVMVQEPTEAGFPSMPHNAIATGVADVVAPVARLAEHIAEVARSKEAVRSLGEDGAANDLRRIVNFLRTRTGHDFSGYKRSTVLRRVMRRMQVCHITRFDDYARHLRDTPEEAKALFADLLISVTLFFRDPDAFAALASQVVAPLVEAAGGDEIRAWVVGCATGEEAYSLAILILEEAERLKAHVPAQIFATDLDEGALATAREGRYPRSIEADVSIERLKRFFVDEGTHYRIGRKVRDLVLFATHSVVREPPFLRLDLVSCRNVLIYLERALQQHVCSVFDYGLKPGGALFLGSAETADMVHGQFVTLDRDARLYRARGLGALPVPVFSAPFPAPYGLPPPAAEGRPAPPRVEAGAVLGASHATALEAVAPPSALVDADHAVLHLSPNAGRFIRLSAGPFSGRLPSIVHPELRLDLKLALARAFDARQPTVTRLVDLRLDGEMRRVSIHVAPVPTPEGAAARATVFFLDNGPSPTAVSPEGTPTADELRQLHGELKAAQEAALAGRIGHEAALQELRASNEELQSLNEEYRSTAEELETSKEELQSINEELQTVNAELKTKLTAISAAHDDLQNLTASSEIGTLFLDAGLRIRMFTPRVAELINVAVADVGRPVTNFTTQLAYPDMEDDVRRVMRDLAPIEREVRGLDDRWFTVRVRPYRTLDNRIEGSVVTFDDTTDRKRGEMALRDSEARFRAFVEASSDAVYRMSPDWREMLWLDGRTSVFETLKRSDTWLDDYIDPADREQVRAAVEDAIRGGTVFALEHRVRRRDGSLGWTAARAVPVLDPEGRTTEWLGTATDVTARREAEGALRRSEELRNIAISGGRMGTWRWDTRGGLVRGDAEFLRPWGLSPSDTDRPLSAFTDRMSPESRAEIGAVVERAFRSGDEFDEQVQVAAGPTAGRWTRWRGQADRDRPWVIDGISFDVTDQRLADQRLRESETRQAFLLGLSDALRPLTDPVEVQEAAMRLVAERLDVTRASYFEADADQDGFTLRARHERDAAAPIPDRMRLADLPPDMAEACRAGRPFVVRDVEVELDGQRAAYRAIGVRAWAAVSLLKDGRLASTVGVQSRTPRDWTGAELRLLEEVADRTWSAVERARAEAALRDSEEQQRLTLQLVPAMLWWCDATGHDIANHEHWRFYTGQGEVGAQGFGWLDAIHPDDVAAARAAFEHAFATGEPIECQLRIRQAGGDHRWHLVRHVPVGGEGGAVARWFGAATDVHELHELQDRQEVLVAELQHRTRNLIAVVRGIADDTLDETGLTEAFRVAFSDRLSALSRVQGLLSRAEAEPVTIAALVRLELDALGVDPADGRVTAAGPDVPLRPSTVQTLALALHELATNARKYGALSHDGGRLAVAWRERAEGGERRLALVWEETGLDRVPDRSTSVRSAGGYGRELIERALPHATGARTTYALTASGVRCTVDIAVRPGKDP